MGDSLRLRLLRLGLRLFVKPALRMTGTPAVFRANFERSARLFFSPPEGSHFVPDTIRRPDGTLMEALWASHGRPDRHRVILYLHGGAYLAGSPRTHRHLGAALSAAAGVRVLLPDYRLAPEHPFPAAPEDALAAYRHLIEAGYEGRHIALAGESAGGGLVFALLLMAADEELPLPAAAAAFSPWTDLTMSGESVRRNARRELYLPVDRAREVIDYYLAGHDPADPRASPIFGAFRHPPPALVMASRSEILRDDAVRIAERLRDAGGDVVLELRSNMPHAWPYFAGVLPEADEAVARSAAFLARHLGLAAAPRAQAAKIG